MSPSFIPGIEWESRSLIRNRNLGRDAQAAPTFAPWHAGSKTGMPGRYRVVTLD